MTASPSAVDMTCTGCGESIEKVVRIGYGVKAFDWYGLDRDGLFDLVEDEVDYDDAAYKHQHASCCYDLTPEQERHLYELMRG